MVLFALLCSVFAVLYIVLFSAVGAPSFTLAFGFAVSVFQAVVALYN